MKESEPASMTDPNWSREEQPHLRLINPYCVKLGGVRNWLPDKGGTEFGSLSELYVGRYRVGQAHC